jgi:hypothetical protein
MISVEATNTNFIVFGLTRPSLEPTISRWARYLLHNHSSWNLFNVMYCYEYVKIIYTVITLYITLTSIILLRMSDCKNTQTSRTSRFCKYLSLIVSHVDIQLEMYKWMNSEGNSTAWNKIKITCLFFVYWKVLTNQRKVISKTFKIFK